MKKYLVILLFISLSFTSCGLHYQVISHDDADSSHSVYMMKLNNVSAERSELGTYGQIWMDAESFKPKGPSASEQSALILSCITFPELEIQTDSALSLKIDSTIFIFSSLPDRYFSKPVEMAGLNYLLESSSFVIGKDIFQKIGLSKSVSFTVKGKERVINATLTSINISRFKSFYEEYVK